MRNCSKISTTSEDVQQPGTSALTDEERRARNREYNRVWREKNREKRKKQQAAYRERHREKIRARHRRWVRENKEANAEHKARWYQANKDAINEQAKQYWRDRPGEKAAHCAKRRAAQMQRTPVWADLEAIKFFYECCPDGCHVDHIIPLQGENISGFHVETNLQWLTAEQNIRKGNTWN